LCGRPLHCPSCRRPILIIDKEGIIRYRRVYSAPHLPDMEEIVRVLQQLAASSPTKEGQQGGDRPLLCLERGGVRRTGPHLPVTGEARRRLVHAPGFPMLCIRQLL
jgi:hypothetical protein